MRGGNNVSDIIILDELRICSVDARALLIYLYFINFQFGLGRDIRFYSVLSSSHGVWHVDWGEAIQMELKCLLWPLSSGITFSSSSNVGWVSPGSTTIKGHEIHFPFGWFQPNQAPLILAKVVWLLPQFSANHPAASNAHWEEYNGTWTFILVGRLSLSLVLSRQSSTLPREKGLPPARKTFNFGLAKVKYLK